jgi:hypothetical protein
MLYPNPNHGRHLLDDAADRKGEKELEVQSSRQNRVGFSRTQHLRESYSNALSTIAKSNEPFNNVQHHATPG